MRSRYILLCAAAALLLAMGPALAEDPAKSEQTALGMVLTNQSGMTLYTSKMDTQNVSACTGACASNWPPFAASAGAQSSGDWSIISRSDGTSQWAYKGKPLYTWKNDQAPGEATGNGMLNGNWQVARP